MVISDVTNPVNMDKRNALDTIDPVQLGDNQLQDWERFQNDFNVYLVANELDGKSTKVKAAILHSLVGRPLKNAISKWALSPATLADLNLLTDAITNKLQPSGSRTFAAFKFRTRTRRPNEDIDSFIEAKRELTIPCKYDDIPAGETINDVMIKDDIILTMADPEFQQYLFREKDLTLAKLRDMIVLNEMSKKQVQTIRNGQKSSDEVEVDAIRLQNNRRRRDEPRA